jgi:hypothetical protein
MNVCDMTPKPISNPRGANIFVQSIISKSNIMVRKHCTPHSQAIYSRPRERGMPITSCPAGYDRNATESSWASTRPNSSGDVSVSIISGRMRKDATAPEAAGLDGA